MELDPISENPCMKPLIAVIRRLHRTITPPNVTNNKIPEWITELSRIMNAPGTVYKHIFMLLLQTIIYRHVTQCTAFPCESNHHGA